MSAPKVGPGVSPGIVNAHLSHAHSALIGRGGSDPRSPPLYYGTHTLLAISCPEVLQPAPPPRHRGNPESANVGSLQTEQGVARLFLFLEQSYTSFIMCKIKKK